MLLLIRKPCYPDENRTMPPRLRYFVYFLDFELRLLLRLWNRVGRL